MPGELSSAAEPPANTLGPLPGEFLPVLVEPLSKTRAGKIASIRLSESGPAHWGEMVRGQFWGMGSYMKSSE